MEKNVNICRVGRINTAPKIDDDLVPRPPEFCKSKGSRLNKLARIIEDFHWDHISERHKERARDVIINHEVFILEDELEKHRSEATPIHVENNIPVRPPT